MKRSSVPLLFCLLCFSIVSISQAADEESQSVQIVNGQPIVFLDKESQKISGLETLQLKQVKFQAELIAYGKAITLNPLLNIRNQYLTASTQQTSAKAHFIQAQNNIARLSNLHKNEVISTRKLQKQQLRWQSDKNLLHVSNSQSRIIINNSNLQWGKTLTKWIIDEDTAELDRLISGESTLLKITLSAEKSLPAQIKSIFVDPKGNRSSAVKASLLNILSQVDAFSQGQQSIFLTDNPAIKAGMNLTAWIPQQIKTQSGVLIPESSLAWHLGQAFVYIKVDEEHFVHKIINNPVKVSNGYFITDPIKDGEIKDGEEIVVTGTQMLLSHEFRSQIPDEDDD